jgi:hypothetical protein
MSNGRRVIVNRFTKLRLALPGCMLIGAALVGKGQDRSETAIGRSRFQQLCTSCHGENAKGARAPNLTTGDWRWGRSDDPILKTSSKAYRVPKCRRSRFRRATAKRLWPICAAG